MNALDYLLKANLYGLLFAGCYWLLLRRHTFFSLNRVYLLTSAVLSLALPLVILPAQTIDVLPVPTGVITLPVSAMATLPVETGPDWATVGLVIYGLIAATLLLRLLINSAQLLCFIRQLPQQRTTDYVLVQPDTTQTPTFSFFRYLILNPADLNTDAIIAHELVHIRQWHSADVLGLALLRSLFWACPFLFVIDKMLRQIHEFLADNVVSEPRAYARFLVGYVFGIRPDALTNGFFNPALLKQRIGMLHRNATSRWALGKYALVLPLALGLLAMTTAREEIGNVITQVTNDPITVSGRVTNASDGKPLSGAIVTVASTGKGAPTDAQGRYRLTSVPSSATLTFSFVGFSLMTVPVSGRTVIHSALSMEKADVLPPMGATAMYKAIKPNPNMPVRTPPSSETINGQVYTAVEEPAVFPTGVPGLMQYVAHALRYPAKARTAGMEGDVYVQFTILPSGSVGSVSVNQSMKPVGGGCEEEAVRVVRAMPKWLPGQQNGKPVATQYQLPIRFALDKKADKRTGQVESTSKPFNVEIDNHPNARFALYNDVKPGFRPNFSDSVPQKTTSIRIRGKGPLGALGEEPLYIIDGVERSYPNTQNSQFDSVDPNDIESITVLKDASAKIQYGDRGKYGVILVTTKKGKKATVSDSLKATKH